MKTYMEISVRVFPVKIKDERTGLTREDTIVLEKSRLQAAQTVGIDSKALIWRIYNKQGYKVLEIGKPLKADLSLELKKLYRDFLECGER